MTNQFDARARRTSRPSRAQLRRSSSAGGSSLARAHGGRHGLPFRPILFLVLSIYRKGAESRPPEAEVDDAGQLTTTKTTLEEATASPVKDKVVRCCHVLHLTTHVFHSAPAVGVATHKSFLPLR